MPKWTNASVLDGGFDLIRTLAGTTGRIKMHLIKAYSAADSYATVVGNSLGSVDLVAADLVASSSGSNRRQTVGAKAITLSASSSQYDSGTASSGGSTTLTDSTKSWTTNVHAGRAVVITSGTGSGQSRRVASNTGTVLTVTAAWTTNPDNTSVYAIRDDLHVALVDSTGSAVLDVTEESSDQVVASGGTFNVPSWYHDFNQPT